MADIATRYQDHTLVICISDTVQAPALGALCVNLVEILSEADRSEDVRSLVLSGQYGFLPNVSPLRAADAAPAATEAWLQNWHTLLEAVDTCAKPVLAAVEGEVSAFGLALAMTCDRLIAGRGVHLQAVAMETVLVSGLSWHFGQRCSRSLASQILLGSAARPNADQLWHAGIGAMYVDAGTALDHALAEATVLNGQPAQCLQLVRELLRQAPTQSLHAQLEAERRMFWKWQGQASGC